MNRTMNRHRTYKGYHKTHTETKHKYKEQRNISQNKTKRTWHRLKTETNTRRTNVPPINRTNKEKQITMNMNKKRRTNKDK